MYEGIAVVCSKPVNSRGIWHVFVSNSTKSPGWSGSSKIGETVSYCKKPHFRGGVSVRVRQLWDGSDSESVDRQSCENSIDARVCALWSEQHR
jgi:hypothetical protein